MKVKGARRHLFQSYLAQVFISWTWASFWSTRKQRITTPATDAGSPISILRGFTHNYNLWAGNISNEPSLNPAESFIISGHEISINVFSKPYLVYPKMKLQGKHLSSQLPQYVFYTEKMVKLYVCLYLHIQCISYLDIHTYIHECKYTYTYTYNIINII